MKVSGFFEVRRPKLKDGCIEEAWNPGNRASMWIMLRRTGGDRLWLTQIGMPFALASTKELKAANGCELYDYCSEMGKAAGVKKPNESQKARALWRMKAARDSGEGFYDPEREDNILRRKKQLEL